MVVAALLLFGSASAPSPAVPSAPVGIPREFAVERAAKVSDLHYDLAYTLVPHAAMTAATEHLRFHLKSNASPLLLDFRDGHVDSLSINGQAAPVNESNGHIILSASALRLGANDVEVDFTANIAAAEKAITRFDDRDDGSEYIYTLFVPMDASMAFPCFDQPDLKARFRLEVSAPVGWTVISNTPVVNAFGEVGGLALNHTEFAETRPISTYLFAFAAGPFQKVHETAGLPGLYVRKSKLQKAEAEAAEVQQVVADGIKYLSYYFAQPFPFPKYH